MKRIIIFLIFCCLATLCTAAYPRLYVYQHCGHKDLTFFYKSGEGSAGIKFNDSCTAFIAPITEPTEIAILVGDDNRHLKKLWLAPGYHDRTFDIDNCTHQFTRQDTLPFDIDDAPGAKIYSDIENGLITEDSFSHGLTMFMESYISAHPDSFLAVHYLNQIKTDIPLDKLIEYKDRIKPHNSQYSDYTAINNYLQNYKYKGVPSIGDPFFEFHTPTVDGSDFDSHSISGKVIVLYFCYSGCGPCGRAAAPLTEVYKKYKAAGVEMLSFSFDENNEDWHKSVAAHKYPGINVSDLAGFNSPLFLHYAVNAFPFFAVFDRNKKLVYIANGTEGVAQVESKVKELLKRR